MKQYYLLELIRGSAVLLVIMGNLRSLMFESWNGGNLFKFIFYMVIINLLLLVSFIFLEYFLR